MNKSLNNEEIVGRPTSIPEERKLKKLKRGIGIPIYNQTEDDYFKDLICLL